MMMKFIKVGTECQTLYIYMRKGERFLMPFLTVYHPPAPLFIQSSISRSTEFVEAKQEPGGGGRGAGVMVEY